MKTKNEAIKELWKETTKDSSISLTKYQLAMIFEYGWEHHKKKTESKNEIEALPLADLRVLEIELSELVDSCACADTKTVYSQKLTKVSLIIANKVKEYTQFIN